MLKARNFSPGGRQEVRRPIQSYRSSAHSEIKHYLPPPDCVIRRRCGLYRGRLQAWSAALVLDAERRDDCAEVIERTDARRKKGRVAAERAARESVRLEAERTGILVYNKIAEATNRTCSDLLGQSLRRITVDGPPKGRKVEHLARIDLYSRGACARDYIRYCEWTPIVHSDYLAMARTAPDWAVIDWLLDHPEIGDRWFYAAVVRAAAFWLQQRDIVPGSSP